MRILLPISLATALATSVQAATHVVDDDGGAGVFTTIQAAIDASSPGDVILIQPGTYAGYTLSTGVTLLGVGAQPVVTTAVKIENVPAGQVAVLSNLRHENNTDIEFCDGTAILDRVDLNASNALDVVVCADVRLYDFSAFGTTDVVASRLEATRATFIGKPGTDVSCIAAAGTGGTALTADSGALVVLSQATLVGGEGGSVGCSFFDGGDGGAGLWIGDASQVTVVGDESAIFGGGPGLGDTCLQDGKPGSGVVIAATGAFLHSSVSITPGSTPGCAPGLAIENLGGALTLLDPLTPTLFSTGATAPGVSTRFTVNAAPASPAFLAFGAEPALIPLAGSPIGVLTSLDLGIVAATIPATGELNVVIKVPPFMPVGEMAFAQAAVIQSGAQLELTGSLPWIVTQ